MSDRKRSVTRAVRTRRKAFAASLVGLALTVVLLIAAPSPHLPWWVAGLLWAVAESCILAARWNERANWERKEQANAGTIRLGDLTGSPHFTLTGKLAEDWQVANWTTKRGVDHVAEGPTLKAHVTLTPRRK
jgi:hypothetical protein